MVIIEVASSNEEGFVTADPNLVKQRQQAVAFSSRFELLDAFRGLASLMVVVFHASSAVGVGAIIGSEAAHFLFEYLWLGVQIFFVISGYCIIAAASSALRNSPSPAKAYLVRRLRRIYPPYLWWLFILVAVLWAVSACGIQVGGDGYGLDQLGIVNWVGNITLTETFLPHFFKEEELVITRVGWTLCYEIQFYFLVFLAILLTRKWTGVLLFGLTIMFAAFFLYELRFGCVYGLRGTVADGRWLQFGLGMLSYAVLTTKLARWRRLIATAILLLGLGVVFWFFWNEHHIAMRFDKKRVFELGFCSIFAAALISIRSFDRELSNLRFVRLFAWIGVWSYSLYLVHWPVCKVVPLLTAKLMSSGTWFYLVGSFSVSIALSMFAGWTFFRAVESRYLNQ